MSYTDDYLALRNKRKKKENETEPIVRIPASETTTSGYSFADEYLSLSEERRRKEASWRNAPVRKAEEERSWFKSGAFEDGYQFGDITKTILGTSADLVSDVGGGLLEIGEKVVDAGAYVVGGIGKLFGADEFAEDTKKFIADDLYDGEKIASWILAAPQQLLLTAMGENYEDTSVFGEKTDALAQSGGQLLGTVALQSVGVPWFVTTGITSFGSGVEQAFNEGATYGEAGLNAAITAGADILTEKLFAGSGLGEKGLINLAPLTQGISSKVFKALADFGVDMVAEGTEEVAAGFISNLGSALRKEENLGEILFSEKAIDEYIESFVGGAVLGGGMNAGKLGSSIKTGKDYRTGLTENEKKVFNKVLEDAITKAEKGGRKLTSKQKAELEAEVMENLEKGYISTDTIEEVLGGENYTSYKSAVDKENALQSEFDTLNKMKQGEMTGEQVDRREELRQQLADIKANTNTADMKTKLGEEVFSLVKDSKLAESYNEKTRRGQAFEADLSQYDEKHQGTIKKAIESGILNNTRRTHEFVDFIAKISADKGVLFDFTNNENLKNSSYAVEGKTVNGFIDESGSVVLNINSAKSLNSTAGHEITHILEGTELYQPLSDIITEYAKTKGEYDSRLSALNKLYEGVYKGEDFDTKVQKELVADLVGDYIFTDKDFVRQLSTKNRNVFQKVYDEIKYLCKVATAGSKEARELEKVKKTFAEVYRESGKVLTEGPQELYKDEKSVDENEDSADNPDMRYSVSEEGLENIEKILYDNNSPLAIVNRAKSNNNSSIKWVYKAEIFSVTENILFHEKISEINQGSQAFQKNSIDEYMLQIENKIVFTDGNYESPYISEIVEVLTDSQTEFEAIKERIFNVEKGKSSKQDAVQTIRKMFGDGIILSYRSGNGGVYGWEDGRRKGKTRRAVIRNYLNKHYGRGNDNQINETKVEGNVNRQATTSEVKLGNNFTDVDGAFFDVDYSLSEETESIDNYTEEQYNNFGWITDNNLVSKQERETLLSRYADYKHNGDKYPTTRFGEAVMHSTECPDVIMYVKGEIDCPNITKILRINADYADVKEMILRNERAGYSQPFEAIEAYFGEGIFDINYKRDYETFREVKARIKRECSQESNTNSGTGQDRAGSVQQNSRIDRADLKGSAFSLSENGENPIKHGNFNIYGSDVKLEAEPTEKTEDIAPVTENIAGKTYISMEDFANQEGSVWNNVDFNDDATKKSITQETHNNMVSEGSVVVVSDEVLTNVEQSFPDLRTIKKKERTPILKEAMNKLKNNIRQFLNNFKNQSFEFEVNGKVLEAKLYNTGINEVLEKVTQEKANMLYSTKDIFKNARYLYSTPDYDGDPNVYRWNYFYTPVQIGENVVGVRIAVRDVVKGTREHAPESQIYNWGIKKDTSLDGESYGPKVASSDVSSDVSAYSISDIASVVNTENIAPVMDDTSITEEEAITQANENLESVDKADEEGQPKTRKQLHHKIIDNIKSVFIGKGFDFDNVLKKAKNLSTFSTVDNTPQRVMEKALGYKEGQALADLTVNKVAQNETEGIKWLNSFTDRKNGLLAQLSKKYNIKSGSKESTAAQMYAEGFYVDKNNDIVAYGDAELAKDFPDVNVQNNIKGLASDPRIRQIYDETLKSINESRARNAYPEIQRLDNYFLHFRAMDDTFSRLGLPFNPNDIRAKDLPTDLNGVTADLKPGQPYFASANHRTGKRTSFDLLGGLERYLTSAKNQIYHIDDIQTLRALRNYIADNYGQANGLEGIDALTEEEAQERIEKVYSSHLSTFAKFLNEEANVLAGKTTLIDRGLEGVIGRRGMTFMDSVRKQVGSNMIGFNVSSSLTNFLAGIQAIAKTNKFACIKSLAQTTASRIGSIFGKTDSFVENNPTIIRRKGAERFQRTPFQKVGDAGYFLMSAVDNVTTEFIVRAKYNEFIKKGMSEEQAITEADKWTSRLMGDRSLGQMPQIYNSKTLGLITQFQLEVRNQLDSQFYDTIQETKASNEDIQNGIERNAKTAAKVTKTFFELAVLQHLFGKGFEAVAGYNPAFDIIGVLATALGFDDDEESEDTALDNIEQGFLELLEDLPYTSVLTNGGRIPISSALPIKEIITGKDEYGNEKSRLDTLKETAPYYLLPTGYGQIKKTTQGLSMFDINEDHPVAGSYTDSGNLRFPVEDTLGNRIQAGIFGQYANENAREYFDNDYAPLKEKEIQEYKDVDIPIKDYWKYREGLKGLETTEEKFDYIDSLDLPLAKKNILANNASNREEYVDLNNYDDFSSLEEFDFATHYPEKYAVAKSVGGYTAYKTYSSELYDIKADKDNNGKAISDSRKEKVVDYINNLNIDYYEKIILFKNEYKADNTYNYEIIDYLNSREDISYEEMEAILKELGFTVLSDGTIRW